MFTIATRPGNRNDQCLSGAVRRRRETTTGRRREARGGANFAVLGASLFCCATLVACGGGGNGGGGGGVVQFASSFPQLTSGGAGGGSPFEGTVQMPGQAVSANFTANSTGGSTSYVLGNPVSESANVRIRVQNGALRSFNLLGGSANINVSTRKTPGAYVHEVGDDVAAHFIDPIDAGYEYQTFGWWSGDPGAASPRWGAASFGRRSEAANLPNSQATYAAKSVGLLVENGKAYGTTSDINISTANYTNVTVSSTGTMKAETMPDGNIGPETRDANLDFTGTGAVTGPGFEVNITDGGSRTGETVGWFYGPNAEEVGGTFNLGSTNSRHIGAFGGKKQ